MKERSGECYEGFKLCTLLLLGLGGFWTLLSGLKIPYSEFWFLDSRFWILDSKCKFAVSCFLILESCFCEISSWLNSFSVFQYPESRV